MPTDLPLVAHLPLPPPSHVVAPTASSVTSTFPSFSALPPELRNQIWAEALPSAIAPAFFFFKTGCWRREDEPWEGPQPKPALRFCYEHLDHVPVEMPLAFVNHETRRIALPWIRTQGLQLRSCGRHDPVFVRPFRPTIDALYIRPDQWGPLVTEIVDRLEEPDLLDQCVTGPASCVPRLAMSEALFRSNLADLNDILIHFSIPEVLLVVMDSPLDLASTARDSKVQRRWQFDRVCGGAFVWDDDRNCFSFHGNGQSCGSDAVARLSVDLKELVRVFRTTSSWGDIRPLEIWPVLAVEQGNC